MASILDNWSTHSVFVLCAAAGGAVLSIQLFMLMFGIDGDADVDLDAGDGFGFVSIRTLSSLLATFGLVGWWALDAGYSVPAATGFGALAGLVMMGLVAWLFSLQSKLHQDGTAITADAVGMVATVYLRIPESGGGMGKITVIVGNRSHEYSATTQGPAIPTGTQVRVKKQITESTFEVETL
jgi:hypothetical protein